MSDDVEKFIFKMLFSVAAFWYSTIIQYNVSIFC